MGLYEKAKQLMQTSVFEGKHPRRLTSDVVGQVITLRDVEFISYVDKSIVGAEKDVEYTVWECIDANGELFAYRGGSALNEIYRDLFMGDDKEDNLEELRRDGLKVILTETTTRSNQPFVNVAVVE